jgi:glycine hydroxymethyltransferase
MREPEMARIAELIERVLADPEGEGTLSAVRSEVRELAARFPLYPAGATTPA